MNYVLFSVALLLMFSINGNAQWEKIAQKPGGATENLCASKFGTLYCTAGDRIYRSVDGGIQWRLRNKPTDRLARIFIATATDTNNREALFELLDKNGTSRDTMFRSTDEGETWTAMTWLKEAFPNENVYQIFTTRFGNLLLATYQNGKSNVYQSVDNGNSFTKVVENLPANPLSIHQTIDSTFYVVGYGETHRITTKGIDTKLAGLTSLTSYQEFSGGPVLLFGMKADGTPVKSANKGDTWTNVVNGFPTGVTSAILRSGKEGEIFAFIRTGADSTRIMRLYAGATTWNEVRYLTHSVNQVVVQQNGTTIITTGDGIFGADDASSTWTDYSQGIEAFPLIIGGILDNNSIVAGSFNGALFSSTLQGQVWGNANLPLSIKGDLPFSDVMFTKKGNIIVSSRKGFLKSNDQGFNYDATTIDGIVYNNQVNGAVQVSDNVIVGITEERIVLSTDDGATWKSVDSTTLRYNNIDITPDGSIIVGTQSGAYKLDKTSYSPSLFAQKDKRCIVGASKSGVNYVLIAEKAGNSVDLVLYRYNGAQETKCGTVNNVTDYPVRLAVANNGSAHINSPFGLHRVTKDNTTLELVNQFNGEAITFVKRDYRGFLIASGAYGGIYWDTTAAGNTGVSVDDNEPKITFTLKPNPTQEFVSIESPECLMLDLNIYDINSRKVHSSVINDYRTVVNVNTLPNGVYRVVTNTKAGIIQRQFTVFK